MRAFTLVAVLATAHASEDCEVIDLPGSLKLDFGTSELLWLCCGKPGKEKLYVYQVPDLPMKQVEVAFRA